MKDMVQIDEINNQIESQTQIQDDFPTAAAASVKPINGPTNTKPTQEGAPAAESMKNAIPLTNQGQDFSEADLSQLSIQEQLELQQAAQADALQQQAEAKKKKSKAAEQKEQQQEILEQAILAAEQ